MGVKRYSATNLSYNDDSRTSDYLVVKQSEKTYNLPKNLVKDLDKFAYVFPSKKVTYYASEAYKIDFNK